MQNRLKDLAWASVIMAAMSVTLHYMSRSAGAQTGSATVVAISPEPLGGQGQTVITADGDVYRVSYDPGTGGLISTRQGNIFAPDGATPVQNRSWGQIKARR